MNEDLKSLEWGILIEDFYDVKDDKQKIEMEFRILSRMTMH